jgi:hypothetical protein
MAKILSVFFFMLAFAWTWMSFREKSDLGIEVHAGIQSKLALLIEDTIRTKRPQSEKFKLTRMQTEKIDDNKVSAFFTYEFQDKTSATEGEPDELIVQKISGTAILVRSLSEDPQVQKWALQSVKTGVESLDYQEGLVVDADPQAPSTDTDTK